jgi:hypothetical protein
MRDLLAAAAVVTIALVPATPASADACWGALVCAVSGCEGIVNVRPTGADCAGTADVSE